MNFITCLLIVIFGWGTSLEDIEEMVRDSDESRFRNEVRDSMRDEKKFRDELRQERINRQWEEDQEWGRREEARREAERRREERDFND